MGKVQLQTLIQAPVERCFDLSRNIDFHLESDKNGTLVRDICMFSCPFAPLGNLVDKAIEVHLRKFLSRETGPLHCT